jgi:hypothetical protein
VTRVEKRMVRVKTVWNAAVFRRRSQFASVYS